MEPIFIEDPTIKQVLDEEIDILFETDPETGECIAYTRDKSRILDRAETLSDLIGRLRNNRLM